MKMTKAVRVEFNSLVSGAMRSVGIDHDGDLFVVGSKMPAKDLDLLIEALQALKSEIDGEVSK